MKKTRNLPPKKQIVTCYDKSDFAHVDPNIGPEKYFDEETSTEFFISWPEKFTSFTFNLRWLAKSKNSKPKRTLCISFYFNGAYFENDGDDRQTDFSYEIPLESKHYYFFYYWPTYPQCPDDYPNYQIFVLIS